MSFPEIPTETLENIIAFLWSDRESLLGCSLVSHRWHSAARPLVFRSVAVKNKNRLDELEDLLSREPIVGWWIKSVFIDTSRTGTWMMDIHSNGGSFDVVPRPVLVERLKKLRSLKFKGLLGLDLRNELSAVFLQSIIQSFPSSVESLTLIDCRGHDGFFLALMHSFPRLRALQSIRMRTNTYLVSAGLSREVLDDFHRAHIPFFTSCTTDRVPQTPHPVLGLTSLKLDGTDFKRSKANVVCLRSLRSLHTLEIRHSGDPLDTLDDLLLRILPECGSTLRTFILCVELLPSLYEEDFLPEVWPPGFNQLKNLRSLELALNPPDHPLVVSLLAACQTTCSKLTALSFGVSFKELSAFELQATVDRALQTFPCQSVTVKEVHSKYCDGTLREETIRVWWAKTFPPSTLAREEGGQRVALEVKVHS
ncbi:hypothetical protein EIP91_009999 [Steccherinum ochraceum]|uniref:F-box domain-containing protein n=1 Tax=Steccherinum ochraceum TaxID=92696 RepID=A0A4R0RR53_9APHY|nr:hypothetical protein EIP91_009999 [Steccherinum ochraceum]